MASNVHVSRMPLGEVTTYAIITDPAESTCKKMLSTTQEAQSRRNKPECHIDDEICQIFDINCSARIFGSSLYRSAFAFFKLRELNGVKITKKKRVEGTSSTEGTKAGEGSKAVEKTDTDFGDIVLFGEAENEVEVYDSYLVFEKMRIKNKNPKTQRRLGIETDWDGLNSFSYKKPVMRVTKLQDRETHIVPVDEARSIYQDEFGKPQMGF
ncbi:uncharacterized protein RAG0_04968 [Rhynchosporium agropyri]|uniref:Uncharacterized protein n=1 Tax=Rhynchosporium agropyri TaxID=914238 RepID=A0A1E1KAZ6_9HELO|nr:uncharacterized protein RAG0_04968 [Rhynchosporium agropyri]